MADINTDQWLKIAELGLGAGGGLLSGLAQGKQNQQNYQLSAQGQLLNGILNANQANPYQQAGFAQQNLMRNALFNGQGNISNASGSYDPATGRGSFSGGLRLPDNFQQQVQPGFTSQFTQPYADRFNQQTGGAIRSLQTAAGFDAQGRPPLPDGYQYGPDGQPQKKPSGFLHALGGILKVAAPIAASFIPGVGPLLGAAIAGGGSAAGTAMQGGGFKKSLISGLVGGGGSFIPGVGGGGAKAASTSAPSSLASNIYKAQGLK